MSGIRRSSARRGALAPRGALARLVLLFALTAGVLGMHTLGHEHAQGVAHPAMAMLVHGDGPHAPLQGRASDGHHRLPLTDPTDVCIAVLVAALVWALLRTTSRPTERRAGAAATATRVAGIRGPPPWPGAGLQLADLAVMRN